MFKIVRKIKSENYIYYQAESFEKTYFIKQVRKKEDCFIKLLQREVECYSLLKEYDFLPRIYRYNLEAGYIVYAYIDGITFKEFRGNLVQKLEIFCRVLEIVEVLHRKGLVHCDLKPSNIMIDKENKVYLIDYANTKKVGEVAVYGTKRYSSVEQLYKKEVTFFFDIYSCGVLLYEILSDSIAFFGLEGKELLEAKKEIHYLFLDFLV